MFTDACNTDVVTLAETNFTQIISLTGRVVLVLQVQFGHLSSPYGRSTF